MQADTLVEQEDKVDAVAPAAPVQEDAPVPQEKPEPGVEADAAPELKSGPGAETAPRAETTPKTAPRAESGPKPEDAEAKPAKRAKSTAKKTRTVELTLTVTGTADGEWQADLVHGTRRVVQGLSISAAAVSRAAKELHEDIAGGIEDVIETARAQHRTRMEELEAELAKVKAALAELND
ncbi:DUF6319 family protein [Saccharothrix longispora]|uniref:Mucin n=1 Tax=Saccharothrix longispora TaxID=33920 RepID=A0ABU1PM56_9PSEU|nr:DUF6319 family protein [Saccharothrix longispora]MDR6591745.1 hypothetical protein [Saccharothrix longispora]